MIRIPENTSITGELRCDGNMEVMGRVEGDGDIKGYLIIGKNCVWIGKAVADTVIVEGTVEGSIIARKKIEITPKAQISGSITAPSVIIPKSARLDCEIHMEKGKQAIDLNEHRSQLKKFVIPKFSFKGKATAGDESQKNIA